jgi:AcrR family transcriptional regulator
VYSNFEGKQDLFLALYETWVARRVDEIEAAWDGGDGLADRARASGDEWMQWFETNPEAFLLRLEFTVRAAHDPDLRRELATRVGAVPLAISRMVERAAQDEGLDLPLPADEIALGLQALSLGLALESLTTRVRPGLNGDLAAFLIELLGARSDA